MAEDRLAEPDNLPGLVRLAAHDLRTPLATISGFAKMMVRAGTLPEREARFVGIIDEAARQMDELISRLSLAAALTAGRHEPQLAEVDTLELAEAAADERVAVEGRGTIVQTDKELVRQALAALSAAALRHGQVDRVTWRVDGTEFVLSPVAPLAEPVLAGTAARDFGALVARVAVESLGGSIVLENGALRLLL
jgi:signal transduction histidine kinase